MGEYWKPVNITKKQFLHPHRFGDGLKWGEWVTCDSTTKRAMLDLVNSGRWSRTDIIRIVSDYGGQTEVGWSETGEMLVVGSSRSTRSTLYENTMEDADSPYEDLSASLGGNK